MGESMKVRARHEEGMRFEVENASGHTVTLDASPHSGGQDAGFRPMEMLLVGLAGCTAMDIVSILREKEQTVTAYEVSVEGTRAEKHPMVFVEITVEHRITGHHLQPDIVAQAVHLSETRYCGASIMLGQMAHVTHTFQLRDAA